MGTGEKVGNNLVRERREGGDNFVKGKRESRRGRNGRKGENFVRGEK